MLMNKLMKTDIGIVVAKVVSDIGKKICSKYAELNLSSSERCEECLLIHTADCIEYKELCLSVHSYVTV